MKKLIVITGLGLLVIPSYAQKKSTYSQAKKSMKSAPAEIVAVLESAPSIYSFTSRFNKKDSTSYTGQTFRQVLNGDLKSYMSKLERGMYPNTVNDAEESLNSYFAFKSKANSNSPSSYGSISGDSIFKTSAKTSDGDKAFIFEGITYNDIQMPGKNLIGKIAGNDNALRNGELKGWNTQSFNGINLQDIIKENSIKTKSSKKPDTNLNLEPEDLVQAFFKITADNAVNGDSFVITYKNGKTERITDASVTPEGLNLAQLTQKLLHGAVSFSQAAADYLSTDLGPKKGLNVDNTKQYKDTKNYTALEHHWDEAFGYFGASRDYQSYTDKQIKKKVSLDTNDDGEITLLSEKNYALSINTARVDLAIGTNLTQEVAQAFIAGRHLISTQPKNYKEYVTKQASIAIGAWEKAFAGMTIHYINSTLKVMNAYGAESYLFYNYSKYWSEMKGFALAFQFNPQSMLTMNDFTQFHKLVGDRPVSMEATDTEVENYKTNLKLAIELIRQPFGFSKEDVNKL